MDEGSTGNLEVRVYSSVRDRERMKPQKKKIAEIGGGGGGKMIYSVSAIGKFLNRRRPEVKNMTV